MNSLNISKVSPMGMATQRMLAIEQKDERVSVGVQRLSEAKRPVGESDDPRHAVLWLIPI